ncbi:MAG: PSD1 domain-containing protein [Planctomycetaceae bacterium]|nr:PSD1 domain-containing protein [Planctomycetaceae bacterium]
MDQCRFLPTCLLTLILIASCGWSIRSVADDHEKVAFFENRIRPVLVDQCYSCHNSGDAAEGGLAVDYRDGLRNGGDSGAAIVPGSTRESLLLRALRHESDAPRMPQDAPRLNDRVIADFERWIADGAADPRDSPPSRDEISQLTSWEAVRDRRLQWWSFQPVVDPPLPVVRAEHWSSKPIDRFLLEKMETAGLAPNARAEPRVLIRRLSFALTGLAPTREQVERFVADDSSEAHARPVDQLLASEHFGERWARHWMDWVRYAETHGSEGDPTIPFAWRYRDYLIRALNADVPYDQLVREHLAGDLLAQPRIDPELGINESMLGTAQYRFVQHGFAPTDALDEQVRFTDNQIDVITKAFQGLTVSCARCHHHKFDPVSQQDFYALYGVMVSTRPATVTIDTPERQRRHCRELTELKARLKAALAEHWLSSAQLLAGQLQSPQGPWADALKQADKPTHPLSVWSRLHMLSGEEFRAAWRQCVDDFVQSRQRLEQRSRAEFAWRARLADRDELARWYRHGTGVQANLPAAAGEFLVAAEGEQIVSGILPAGVYSNLLSSKHNGVLASRRIPLGEGQHLYVRVRGDGEARARYAVQHYPRRGTVYPLEILKDGRERWVHWDMTYWAGDVVHVEIGTAADLPVESNTDVTRSAMGVTEAILLSEDDRRSGWAPTDEMAELTAPLFDAADNEGPIDTTSLAALYSRAVSTCVIAWRDGTMTDEQARFLDGFVRENLLANQVSELEAVAALVDQYRTLESQVPVPTRAPGVTEADVIDQPLFPRGDHKRPDEIIPRRYLEVLEPHHYNDQDSGRLELAEDLLRANNPLTARVIVNRVWHHLFGRGLVATSDNFGRLGTEPSHPQLLDWLAVRFVEEGWSLKQLIRRIVLSQAYQLDSTPTSAARQIDPDNVWLSHAPLRRLEAEVIRDALLWSAGELDSSLFGPPEAADSTRRSIYLAVRRNEIVPLLSVFDLAIPFSTQGRRDVTNVPGQSLTLMNDPFVNEVARRWTVRLLVETSEESDAARIHEMFESALGRPPSSEEIEHAAGYLAAAAQTYAAAGREDVRALAWQELAMAFFNMKEFLYVR